jgi:hypothetical protein
VETEQVANFCEIAIADKLSHFNDSEVVRFTESIRHGVRYIGFKQGGKTFFIELKVEEA